MKLSGLTRTTSAGLRRRRRASPSATNRPTWPPPMIRMRRALVATGSSLRAGGGRRGVDASEAPLHTRYPPTRGERPHLIGSIDPYRRPDALVRDHRRWRSPGDGAERGPVRRRPLLRCARVPGGAAPALRALPPDAAGPEGR